MSDTSSSTELEYQCRNCNHWWVEPHSYCPECHYSTVHPSTRDCPLCRSAMTATGEDPAEYHCPDCDREWIVTRPKYADEGGDNE